MTLPLKPPFAPMEALSVKRIPSGDEWAYEPKWDGFRCLAFRDGAKVELQSKSSRSMTRYFPELVAALAHLRAKRFVLDGESVVPSDGAFSFDALLQRIHPAPSRVRKLADETPALLILFDLLVDAAGEGLTGETFAARRSFAFRQGRPNARKPSNGCAAAVPRSTASSPSAATCPTAPANAPACRRSRTSAAPTAWWGASATTKVSR